MVCGKDFVPFITSSVFLEGKLKTVFDVFQIFIIFKTNIFIVQSNCAIVKFFKIIFKVFFFFLSLFVFFCWAPEVVGSCPSSCEIWSTGKREREGQKNGGTLLLQSTVDIHIQNQTLKSNISKMVRNREKASMEVTSKSQRVKVKPPKIEEHFYSSLQ